MISRKNSPTPRWLRNRTIPSSGTHPEYKATADTHCGMYEVMLLYSTVLYCSSHECWGIEWLSQGVRWLAPQRVHIPHSVSLIRKPDTTRPCAKRSGAETSHRQGFCRGGTPQAQLISSPPSSRPARLVWPNTSS